MLTRTDPHFIDRDAYVIPDGIDTLTLSAGEAKRLREEMFLQFRINWLVANGVIEEVTGEDLDKCRELFYKQKGENS